MVVKQKTILAVAVFLLLICNVATLSFLLISQHTGTVTGRAQDSGVASFCINSPPVVDTSTCNRTMVMTASYFCTMNYSDNELNNVTFSQLDFGPRVFTILPNGTISFTPNSSYAGNFSTRIIAVDSSGCANAVGNRTFNYSIIKINYPPVLYRLIPDISFPINTSYAFFLTDFFMDPNGDPMTFTSTIPSNVVVSIDNVTSRVTFTGNDCVSTGSSILFTAKDPYNATGDSNIASVKVTCAPPVKSDSGGQSSGGGGGGGGGSIKLCKSLWECEEWFACLPAGIQWRRCFDTHGCTRAPLQLVGRIGCVLHGESVMLIIRNIVPVVT